LGVDIPNNWFVNVDGRYIDMDTEATISGPAINGTTDVQIDPSVFTLAVGRRF
jgi:outer membrane protein W